MKAKIKIGDTNFNVDLSEPIDISIPLRATSANPIAWNLGLPKIEPVQIDDWVGKVSEGASVNFNTITFNPHAHGTHTECVGHITSEFHSVNELMKEFFFFSELITITPEKMGDDLVITANVIKDQLKERSPQALIIRTLPNEESKATKDHSNSNWPYLNKEAAKFVRELGVVHLLIDTPSVDKEKDNGKLEAHKAFWNYPNSIRLESTITEMIYVSDEISDGTYLLAIHIAPFHNDACPSKPILYRLLNEYSE